MTAKVLIAFLLIVFVWMAVAPGGVMAKDPPNRSLDPCDYAAHTGFRDLYAVWHCVFEVLRDLWATGQSHWVDHGGC